MNNLKERIELHKPYKRGLRDKGSVICEHCCRRDFVVWQECKYTHDFHDKNPANRCRTAQILEGE